LESAPDKGIGWVIALAGPILDARNSTQAQRNEDNLGDLIADWKARGIEILDFKIAFPKDVAFFDMPTETGYRYVDEYTVLMKTKEQEEKRYQPPLSWTLTKKQREAIRKAWRQLADDPSSRVAELVKAWRMP
jgi:hypothetical protein